MYLFGQIAYELNDVEVVAIMIYSNVNLEKLKWKNSKWRKPLYKERRKCHVLARFIWNAEISISIAIHCYEPLF